MNGNKIILKVGIWTLEHFICNGDNYAIYKDARWLWSTQNIIHALDTFNYFINKEVNK